MPIYVVFVEESGKEDTIFRIPAKIDGFIVRVFGCLTVNLLIRIIGVKSIRKTLLHSLCAEGMSRSARRLERDKTKYNAIMFSLSSFKIRARKKRWRVGYMRHCQLEIGRLARH